MKIHDNAVWRNKLPLPFTLFFDAEAGMPSVVYRRKGFDYGVIRMA